MFPTDSLKKTSPYWFLLPLALALVIRLPRLGDLPLSDAEATWALQSLSLLRGSPLEIGSNPLYVNLTAFFFFLFQPGNMTARLFPALMGAVLSLVPFFFRDRLGYKPALILAFVLAVEPGLTAFSRQAPGSATAITLLLLAWGLWRSGFLPAAGVAVGLALLSGPTLWLGLPVLALAAWLARKLFPSLVEDLPLPALQTFRPALWWVVGAYLSVGSLFLLAPNGLMAGLGSFASLSSSFSETSETPAWRLLLTLAVYQPLFLLLGIWQFVRGWLKSDLTSIFLGLWFVLALIVALLLPNRQVADLGWALLPLAALASLGLAEHIVPVREGTWETPAVTALVLVMLAFAWVNFSALSLPSTQPDQFQMRQIVIFGALGLLTVSIVLIAFGWSVQTALQGAGWGVLIALAVYTLGMTFASAQLRATVTPEMWPSGPQVAQAKTMLSQMSDISLYHKGVPARLDVTLLNIQSPALRWLLRDWDVRDAQALAVDALPALIVSPINYSGPELQSGYRGMALSWRSYPVWDQMDSPAWLNWITRHSAMPIHESVILWVRSDLFVDAQSPIP